MNAELMTNPNLARKIAANAAKTLVQLHYNMGVVGIDHDADIPTVQMENLNALRNITGGVKLKMERKGEYTRYSAVVDGTVFFFLSLKQVETKQ